MKRHSIVLVLVLAFTIAAGCAPAMYSSAGTRTYMGFSIGISNAPPPPRVVYVEEPRLVVVPGTRVYVVEDGPYDLFRYSSSWYLSSGGFWYRSYDPDGPFVAVDVRSVPRQVLSVPARHWKHHPLGGPPGQMKKRGPGRG